MRNLSKGSKKAVAKRRSCGNGCLAAASFRSTNSRSGSRRGFRRRQREGFWCGTVRAMRDFPLPRRFSARGAACEAHALARVAGLRGTKLRAAAHACDALHGAQLAKVAQRADARSGPSRGEAAARRRLRRRVCPARSGSGRPADGGTIAPPLQVRSRAEAASSLRASCSPPPRGGCGLPHCVRCVTRAEACGARMFAKTAGLRCGRLRPADGYAIASTLQARSRAEGPCERSEQPSARERLRAAIAPQ